MKKKRVIKVLILTAVFIVAVGILSYITNRGNADMTADMGAATLPRIAFFQDEYEINELAGYVNEMDMTAVRDTITPLTETGTLNLQIKKYERKIEALSYEVYTLDGQTKLLEGNAEKLKSPVTLSLAEALKDADEALLKVTIKTESQEAVYYYTRIVKSEGMNTKECLDFVKKFQEAAIEKKDAEFLSGLIETDGEADTAQIQHVTLNSDIKQIEWGALSPEVVGDISISIKEARTTYTSVLLSYRVKSKGDGDGEDLYNVNEFFRVRSDKGKMYLLSYDRTLNQVFEKSEQVMAEQGITLGIAPTEVQYMSNSEGNIVSFVQERELWNYNKENSELSLVFSFAVSEAKDLRNLYDQHELKLIDVDKEGNTIFVVYGYMNRGEHEGEVGAAIYYYSMEKNSVEEKIFIPSKKAFGIAVYELGDLMYYSKAENILYTMSGGSLYKADLGTGKKETLVENLKEGQYASSADGHLLAYQTHGSIYEAEKIIVLNLKSGEQNEIKAGDGDSIRPLGFVFNDFVYGMAKKSDAGNTVSGEALIPMYALEIRDQKNTPAKTYQAEGVYISSVEVKENMITLHRVTKNGELYTPTTDEHITNNQEKEEGNISLETFTSDLKGEQIRIRFADGINDQTPKILTPKQVLFEKPKVLELAADAGNEKFLVYGKGKLLGVYEKVSAAVQLADASGGVVIASDQSYVWERGNRDLNYQIENMYTLKTAGGDNSLAACINAIARLEGTQGQAKEKLEAGEALLTVLSEAAGGQSLDLTGCSVEELLYIIGRGTPVLAMTDAEHAVLLAGYGSTMVTYIDLSSGKESTVTQDEIIEMTAASGNTFLGYLK